ncbi:MAG: NAD(P)H-hydrate dehydratase [Rikenellaceae bacterium]
MKILTSSNIKLADKATIEAQDINSLTLMEQAAELLSQWVCNNVEQSSDLLFFIGKGGNGGDGLAMARMLSNVGFKCSVMMCYEPKKDVLSADAHANYKRLPSAVKKYTDIEKVPISEQTVIVDAMLGVGLRGECTEPILSMIELINSLENRVISIDIPSGMPSDLEPAMGAMIQADNTLSLYAPKLNMLMPECGENCGRLDVLDLELETDDIASPYFYVTSGDAAGLTTKRRKFSHKGNYGHALLVCGSDKMMGAASLSLGAALRSGAGYVSLHLPYSQRFAIQANYPSAVLSYDKGECFSSVPENLENYNVVGVGCGLGVDETTTAAFEQLLKQSQVPMVIDADALNILAQNTELQAQVPSGSVLTPHLGELKRLVGEWTSEKDKLDKVQALATRLDSCVVVKGAYSMIVAPTGMVFFNSTLTPALAKAGSGDVLTGLITGLMARGYNALRASVLGVYLHGRAGEKGAEYQGVEGLNSGDLIDFISEAYIELE